MPFQLCRTAVAQFVYCILLTTFMCSHAAHAQQHAVLIQFPSEKSQPNVRTALAQLDLSVPTPTQTEEVTQAEVASRNSADRLPPDSESPSDIGPNDESDEDSSQSDNPLMPLQSAQLASRVTVVDLSVSGLGTGDVPSPASANRFPEVDSYSRNASHKHVYWQSSQICHFPLRFEDAMLERHGHVRFGHLQPLASGIKFFGTIPMIPYLNTLQSRHEPVYALGNDRPGSCAPLLRDTIPYDKHAAVVEALSLAGFFWAMPL